MKVPESLKDTTIRHSNHGWLLMTKKDTIHLYNPSTGDVISTETDNEDSFFFASKPCDDDSDCRFVAVTFVTDEVYVDIYYPRTNTSTGYELECDKGFYPLYDVPVLFEDAFYYIDENGCLGKLIVEDENTCSWEVLEQPHKTCNSFHQIFLVECEGELLSVFIGSAGKYVLVYKLNASKSAWEIVTTLGKYSLYLSRCSSFSAVARFGEGNRIYFPRFRDGGISFYSLDTRKWHSLTTKHSFDNFYDTKLLLNSCWINPS